MTDGIIQEVIEKYGVRHIEDIDGLMEELQQELIEKIKEELTHASCNTNCKSHMKKLIGDNNG